MKINRKVYLLIPFILIFFTIHAVAQKREPDSVLQRLKLWDDKPAGSWMTEAYPIGNGRMGGMVFGGVAQERIQFNEISLWTGDEQNTGTYQAFGDLYLNFENKESAESPVQNYRRELDLNRAVHHIKYMVNDIEYGREYFCSFPHKLMAMRYTSSKKGMYSVIIKLKDAHQAKTTAEGTTLQLKGKLENGMAYSASVLVRTEGGKAAAEPDHEGGFQLHVKNADAFTLLLTAATDYSGSRTNNWKGREPHAVVKKVFASVANRTFPQMLAAHIQDYQSLFGRVQLNLGNTSNEALKQPTYKRLIDYKKAADPQLEAMLFQYGRYLLISSSRKGGLPANLQGLWNDRNDPPWRSDYHSNINIQMNYWLAEQTNLSECHFPYLDYINSMREVKKISTKKQYPGVRGWTVKTENNIFGGESFLWNTPGSAWYAQAIWEHYAFTKDKGYLKTLGYPILKEISEFWDDHLKRRPDGTLVSPAGWSPEHGPTEDGVTYDQQIVYDLFTNYIAAADALNIDQVYRNHIADLRSHLLKLKIGKWGQLQEWETDRDDPKDQHRHVSHLFGLHPGREISVAKTPELAKAAKVSLLARGDASTGWSMAWKMNFWARLQDGNHAYAILKNFIRPVGGSGVDYNEGGGIYSNLFCAHPPFQIDGNFGYTAAVSEMLVQSQSGEIQLLPAIPAEWATGYVNGLKARGGFEIVQMKWEEGKVVALTIKSSSGGNCVFHVPNALKFKYAELINYDSNGGFKYNIKTQAGDIYHFYL